MGNDELDTQKTMFYFRNTPIKNTLVGASKNTQYETRGLNGFRKTNKKQTNTESLHI